MHRAKPRCWCLIITWWRYICLYSVWKKNGKQVIGTRVVLVWGIYTSHITIWELTRSSVESICSPDGWAVKWDYWLKPFSWPVVSPWLDYLDTKAQWRVLFPLFFFRKRGGCYTPWVLTDMDRKAQIQASEETESKRRVGLETNVGVTVRQRGSQHPAILRSTKMDSSWILCNHKRPRRCFMQMTWREHHCRLISISCLKISHNVLSWYLFESFALRQLLPCVRRVLMRRSSAIHRQNNGKDLNASVRTLVFDACSKAAGLVVATTFKFYLLFNLNCIKSV